MNVGALLHIVHLGCLVMIVLFGFFGLYKAILMHRQLKRRDLEKSEDFLRFVSDAVRQEEYAQIKDYCGEPDLWYRAVSILTRHAIDKQALTPAKLRHSIAARYAREIAAPLEAIVASINIVIRCEPMLGLFGTVAGMIGAFSSIATMDHPSPQALMGDLSHALNATAGGIGACIPLMLIVNYLQVRMRKFEDNTFDLMDEVLEELDAVKAQHAEPARRSARSGR